MTPEIAKTLHASLMKFWSFGAAGLDALVEKHRGDVPPSLLRAHLSAYEDGRKSRQAADQTTRLILGLPTQDKEG